MGQKIKSDQYFSALRANRDNPTAALVLEDGSVFTGYGFGAAATNTGEVCFNTSMTGYQETYRPFICRTNYHLTFPHIGNVGINDQDFETHAGGSRVNRSSTDNQPVGGQPVVSILAKIANLPGISGRAYTRSYPSYS